MTKSLKILMVDDHALILEGYKSKLIDWSEREDTALLIDTAQDCDEALERIKNLGANGYHIAFLDISLPASKDLNVLSGEDLGKELRKVSPQTSLMVLTMHSDTIRLMSILKNLNPDGFLIKSDVTPQGFLKAFAKVLEGKVHYSQTIIEILRKRLTSDIILDDLDRNILFFLAEGVRTKDLVKKVPASLASIEKRKRMMKEIFEVEREGDLALINKAKKLGFL